MQKVHLESVRRKSGGRIHLTPRVPRVGPVTTLCGQTLDDGSYAAVGAEPDCANCLRRSHDQARISGAFFAQEEGSELLRLSLEQAKTRKPNLRVLPTPPATKEKPVEWPAAKAPQETVPDQVGELVTRGFKPSGEGVWRSPQGVIVRLRRHGKEWRFAELVFEGEVVATRGDDGLRLKAGDVELAPTDDGFEVRLRKKP
ncbi:MAG: hypothetical protein E6I04_05290 [Chloroflexi bacterium]|nr:MAG: hypothetical protein E6I92_03475 [Chloroflexota bacterium]TMF98103.1 MAG: hypothetical protein E6I04_05290 [Chloroflexota bacterium]